MHKKKLENVYLGNIKRFTIYVGHKKQLENVYLGNMMQFIIYVGHKKKLGVPGER